MEVCMQGDCASPVQVVQTQHVSLFLVRISRQPTVVVILLGESKMAWKRIPPRVQLLL